VTHRVTVVTRTGCHACEVAEREVERVCAELAVPWSAADVHGYWQLEEARFRAALAR
jgi:hypothetical protein